MAIKFNQTVKHGRLQFSPGLIYAFEDENAEPYFIKLGWAEKVKGNAEYTYSKDDVEIDVETVVGTNGPDTGAKVL